MMKVLDGKFTFGLIVRPQRLGRVMDDYNEQPTILKGEKCVYYMDRLQFIHL